MVRARQRLKVLSATCFLLFSQNTAAQRHGTIKPPAQDGDLSWKPLVDDTPRGEFFERLKNLQENKESSTDDVAFPFRGNFRFPTDVIYDDIAQKERQNTLFGIDLSHYSSSEISIDLLKQQGVYFVYAKATQGTRFADSKFASYWNQLGSLSSGTKILRGAYHFLAADIDGTQQADRYVDYVDQHGGFRPNDMPPCVDIEWDVVPGNSDRWRNYPPRVVLKTLTDWLIEVERRTHRVPMIYTARAWWDTISSRDIFVKSAFQRLSRYPLWVADYSRSGRFKETPGAPSNARWTLWQFTASSSLSSGYPTGKVIDASVYKGSIQQFWKDFNIKVSNPT